MYYNNPNLNVMILSPGRTGSTLIWDVFSKISKVTPIRRNCSENVVPLKSKECLHSHDPNDVFLGNTDTLYIINTRDLVDIALSSGIAKHTNKYYYYKNESFNIQPFIFNVDEFMRFYESKKKFYENLKPIMPKTSVVVDYSLFCDDIETLFDIFYLSKKSLRLYPKSLIPQKVIGTHKDWILNYDEILEAASNLERKPSI